MNNLQKANIEFNVDGKPVKFSVIHNLPANFGLNIDGAVDNWLARTEEYTAQSLVDYINSKNTGYFCITEREYNKIMAQT